LGSNLTTLLLSAVFFIGTIMLQDPRASSVFVAQIRIATL
jgi:hypothetical protein